jgi:Cys-tRNA(Pro)/Cys-tRNA(Cys) deacylase
MSMKKTNAARFLDSLKINYKLCEYEIEESDLSAESVAKKVGLPPEQVFKTLVTRGDKTGVLMACIPGNAELDLKATAPVSGNKKVEMVPMKEIQQLTGYIRGGVSPIGTKKHYPIFLDESAIKFPFISISAGARGSQIFISPEDLIETLGITVCTIGQSKPR